MRPRATPLLVPATSATAATEAERNYQKYLGDLHRDTDRVFILVLLVQWIACTAMAHWTAIRAGTAPAEGLDPKVWLVLVGGGVIAGVSTLVAFRHPGEGLHRGGHVRLVSGQSRPSHRVPSGGTHALSGPG